MSGWITVETHSLNGEFSQFASDYLEEKIQSITQNIIYKTPKRIVGKSGYGMYPDDKEIRKISRYNGVGVAVCEANDTSDIGETELFIDGERVEHFANDRLCSDAISKLKDRYGIYLYANYRWEHINCKIVDKTNNRYNNGSDGKLSVEKSYQNDIEVLIEEELAGENKIIEAQISNQGAVKLLEELDTHLED